MYFETRLLKIKEKKSTRRVFEKKNTKKPYFTQYSL